MVGTGCSPVRYGTAGAAFTSVGGPLKDGQAELSGPPAKPWALGTSTAAASDLLMCFLLPPGSPVPGLPRTFQAFLERGPVPLVLASLQHLACVSACWGLFAALLLPTSHRADSPGQLTSAYRPPGRTELHPGLEECPGQCCQVLGHCARPPGDKDTQFRGPCTPTQPGFLSHFGCCSAEAGSRWHGEGRRITAAP